MRLRSLVAVLALATGAVGSPLVSRLSAQAAAQPSRLSALPAALRTRIAPLIDSARAAGVPVGKLESLALEGSRKNAPPDAVASAVRKLFAATVAAQRALGAGATAEDVELGAEAVTRAVAPTVLTSLRASAPGRPVTVALTVLNDLVARGVAPDSAGSIIVSLAGSRAGDAQLAAFKSTFEKAVAVGAPPAAAATAALASDRGTGVSETFGATNGSPTSTATPAGPQRP